MFLNQKCSLIILLTAFSLSSTFLFGQLSKGVLGGKVINGASHQAISGVRIAPENGKNIVVSGVDGSYQLRLVKGSYTIIYSLPGFQTKQIGKIKITRATIRHQNVILFPFSSSELKKQSIDSVSVTDSIIAQTSEKENQLYLQTFAADAAENLASGKQTVVNSLNETTHFKVDQLSEAILVDNRSAGLSALMITGMGGPYNQMRLNGWQLNAMSSSGRAYTLSAIPGQAIDYLTLNTIGSPSQSPDYSGGAINIQLKEMPENNFIYLGIGGAYLQGTTGKELSAIDGGRIPGIGLPGKLRNLPPGFPTTRSPSNFNDKNPQEKVFLSKMLANNLAPIIHPHALPSQSIQFGAGKLFSFKNGKRLGIYGFLNQNSSNQILNTQVQAAPDLSDQSFPFNQNKPLIRFGSTDSRNLNTTESSALIVASFYYNKSKISFNAFVSNQFSGTYVNRSQFNKPDEDTAANAGLYISAVRRSQVNAQLLGEHSLNETGNFKLRWQFNYSYNYMESPDERNIALREQPGNPSLFEIAHSATTPYTADPNNPDRLDPNLINTSRTWKESNQHDFGGQLGITTAFNAFHHAQLISGGILIRSTNKHYFSDLLFVQGPGLFTINELFSPSRYYPGGLELSAYHVNNPGSRNVYANELGNYLGTANTGAAFFQINSHLTDHLHATGGIRLETFSQLVSNTQYNYVTGYRYPQLSTLDENTHSSEFNFLPSVVLTYSLPAHFTVYGTGFLTVIRPQIQQLTKFREYDGLNATVAMGNPLLKNSHVTNYEAGIKWSMRETIALTIGSFYKRFIDPIEDVLSAYTPGTLLITPNNTANANLSGLRASVTLNSGTTRKSTAKDPLISININTILLHSKVAAAPLKSEQSPSVAAHSLFQTPDITLKGAIIFAPFRNTKLIVLSKYTSGYIRAIGSGTAARLSNDIKIPLYPDYRIRARQQTDIQLSQQFFADRLMLSAGVQNLFNKSYTEYQDLNGNNKFDSPLVLHTQNGKGGFYSSGTDNTLLNIKYGQSYFLNISYLFH